MSWRDRLEQARGEEARRREGEDSLLVLGPEVPPVEDTTPAELQRQHEALRHQHQELQRRRARLERREQALERRRRRERPTRRPARTGQPVPLRPAVPLTRWLTAGALAVAGVALTGAASDAQLIGSTKHAEATAFVHADRADLLWQETALALDAELVSALAEHEALGGPASTELARRAAQLVPTPAPEVLSTVTENWPRALQETRGEELAATWQQTRAATASAVGDEAVAQARGVLEERSPAGLLPRILGFVALLGAAGVLWAGGAQLATVLLAGAALCAGGLGVGQIWQAAAVERLAEDHQEARVLAQRVPDQVQLDLATHLGLHDPGAPGDTWWTEPPFEVGDFPDLAAQNAYQGSRTRFGWAGPDATGDVAVHGLAMIRDAERLQESETARVVTTRDALEEAALTGERPTVAWVTVLAAVLGLGALALARPVRTRPDAEEETR